MKLTCVLSHHLVFIKAKQSEGFPLGQHFYVFLFNFLFFNNFVYSSYLVFDKLIIKCP